MDCAGPDVTVGRRLPRFVVVFRWRHGYPGGIGGHSTRGRDYQKAAAEALTFLEPLTEGKGKSPDGKAGTWESTAGVDLECAGPPTCRQRGSLAECWGLSVT